MRSTAGSEEGKLVYRKQQDVQQPEKKKRDPLRVVLEWTVTLLVGVVLSIFITQVLIVNAQVPTGSMEPTIHVNDRVIGLRTAYWFGQVQRGDLVIFRFPDDESQLFVKRVIGMPGEVVTILNGQVYIDDEEMAELYLGSSKVEDLGPFQVPADSYFVMGDNRADSYDSRYWNNQFVRMDQIVGKAWLRLFPNPKMLR